MCNLRRFLSGSRPLTLFSRNFSTMLPRNCLSTHMDVGGMVPSRNTISLRDLHRLLPQQSFWVSDSYILSTKGQAPLIAPINTEQVVSLQSPEFQFPALAFFVR